MQCNRKGNMRGREKELLYLFVKRSGQSFKGKKEMGEDGRVGKGREEREGGDEGEEEWEGKRKERRRKGQGKGRERKSRKEMICG
jgi:hypothetical protein